VRLWTVSVPEWDPAAAHEGDEVVGDGPVAKSQRPVVEDAAADGG